MGNRTATGLAVASAGGAGPVLHKGREGGGMIAGAVVTGLLFGLVFGAVWQVLIDGWQALRVLRQERARRGF